MDSQEQQHAQTASVSNPYLLRLKCFLCKALNPNVNDENNNLKKTNSNTNENSFNPISKLPLYTCPDCEAKIRLEEKEISSSSTITSQNNGEPSERMIIVPDTSSDEDEDDEDNDDDSDCWCPACVSLIDDEHDSKYRELWEHLAHIVKCLYRTTDKDFSENQLSSDISKAKQYVKKLTKLNPQSLFNKLESLVLDYVREIRKQVLERFHTCSKTSHDVQLFISFLLDEYQMFIQAANNVSSIVAYLEEHYMKSFHLTWLLYNKHLYEELIYMDRKIHHSMTTMIDLLQPANDDANENHRTDYSPAEYTQLLNRFLAFDEEMSEIACLYKDSQAKLISKTLDLPRHNGSPAGLKTKKKRCKKLKNSAQLTSTAEETINSSTSTAVDIPTSTDGVPAEHGSNGSSVGSGLAGDEFSSASSIDDQLLDNDTSSSGYTQEEQEELARLIFNDDDMNEYLLQEILNSVSPYGRIQQQIDRTRSNEKQKKSNLTTMSDNDEWISRIIHEQAMSEMEQKIADDQEAMIISSIDTLREEATNSASASVGKKSSSSSGKSKSSKSSSRRRKEASLAAHLTPPPPPPNSNSCQLPKKSIAADLLLPRSIADLSAKIQSVSFTAGTFGSITSSNPQDSHHSLSSSSSSSSSSNCSTTTLTAAKTTTATGQTRLSINLTRKPGFKPTEHGGQKIAEALFNELTSLGNGESATRETLNSGRKKDNQQFKKTKQQRPTTISSTINETLLGSATSPSFFGPANKSETTSASSSSSTAYNNLDHLLRHAASNADVSEAALHSILSSFHSPTCLDPSSSKHSLSSKTTEALQALIAQQQSHHHHHQQQHKKTLLANHKRCEFCSCEFPEGRTSSVSPCLHSPTTSNGNIAGCVTCMALPGSTTTTTSVLGTAISGAFNPRGIELKERLKLKLTKRTVQGLTEVKGPETKSQQEKKKTTTSKATEKKPAVTEKNPKTKDFLISDKNNIDDLVRFIDGDETPSTSNHHEQQISTTATAAPTTTANTPGTASHESTSKKSRKKKEKQAKATVQPTTVTSPISEEKSNTSPAIASSERTSPSPAPSPKPSPTPVSQAQQPLSKRKLKAKLKQEQQEQQQKKETSNAVDESLIPSKPTVSSTPVPPPPPSSSSSSSQGTPIHRGNADRPCEPLDSPEEEVNWITISRKQSKHKPSTPSVPSLLATPVLPVVPPPSTKQQRPATVAPPVTSSTKKSANTAQPKVIPSIANLTSNTAGPVISKAQTNNTSLGGPRQIPTTLPAQKLDTTPSTNLWKTNTVHEQTPVMSPGAASFVLTSSSLLATTPSYVPSHPAISSSSSLLSPMPAGSTSSSSDDYPSTIGWDTNAHLLPTTAHQTSLLSSAAPGPVQRRHPSFSPAPGTLNHTTSRCIQRPSPEPRSSSSASTAAPFPLYFPMAYARPTNSTSTWNETPLASVAHESQWNYPQEAQQQFGLASGSTSFPLYDPFHSGAGLPMPHSSSNQTSLLTNGFAEHFTDLYGVPHDNDVNDMDALDKEIEDYKKFCFENVPLETREKMQVNPDRCFVRQA